MSLRIDQIRRDGGTQSRAAINDETVAEYAEAMSDPDTMFPPIIVYFDGREYWLADGFHRLAAWERIGRTEIPAEIRQGDRRRAILHSVAANSAHGLRRTNADKRRAVTVLLSDDEWSRWSNREIARRCAVSDPFVAKMRDDLSANGLQIDVVRRVERGGTTYEQNTANIGETKPDQEIHPTPADAERDAGVDGTSGGGSYSPTPEPTPDPYGYARLTEEALLDLANGLRADLDDEKARRKKAEADVRAIKAQVADLTADDKDGVIRRLQAEVKNADNAKWKALEDRDAYHRQVSAIKKRVAELEKMGVAY